MKRALLLLFCLAACKTQTAAAPPAGAQPAAKPDTQAAWNAVVNAPDRDAKDRALDAGRHPAEMLQFLDLKPGMKVADLGAGGGYTTELLARAVGPSGVVYMQNDPSWMPFLKDAIAERLTHPPMKSVVRADVPFGDVLPPEAKDLDAVVMNVIYHDIANMPVDRVRMNRVIFNALKPGGEYVVIDSSAMNGSGTSATATLHRIDEQVVKEEVEKAGFKLAQESDFLRNPQDTRDWNSSPGAAAKLGKRGQSDRFALKFIRPEGSAQQIISPRLRLPKGVRPERYSAVLTIDPAKDEFQAEGELTVKADAPVELLWLNADELKITGVTPKAKLHHGDRGFVGLRFDPPLPAGTSTVKLQWTGPLSRKEQQGLYRQQENGEWYVLSQGEPLGMRRVLPCFDEPSYKIPWTLSLRVPKADAAFFNTGVQGTEEQGDQKLVHFAETKPLPSYLLAFGVGPFQRVDAGKMQTGQPVGIVVTHGKTSWTKDAVHSAPRLMNILEDYFQVPYHYPKLDLIEVPLGGGAMENPGLITFAQRILVARPGTETPRFVRANANVEAHEFAHLWFGDMVTTAWWDDLWLNEAFATWLTGKAISKYAPSWDVPADRALQLDHAMDEDSLLSARRIRQPIESEGDIRTAFDAITYQKGSAVIGMFEQWVGPEQFRKGVKRYLEAHADSNGTEKDFLDAISADAGKDVSPAFSTFLDQAGLPLVSMKLSCEGGKGRLELSQSRYLPLGAGQARDQLWQIPVCVRTEAGPSCTLLAEKTGALELSGCPKWVAPNLNASGYYRSSLDDAAATALTQNVGKLSVPERIIFFSDVDAAARAGAADPSRTFDLLEALAGDKDWHVIEQLTPPLRSLRSHGIVPDEALPQLAAFVRGAFQKRARALGFAEKKGESDDVKILRPDLLRVDGDEGQDVELRTQAQKVALKWLANHKTASPDIASAALYLSAIDADAVLQDKLHAAAKAEKDRIERLRILEALGQVRDPELAKRNFATFLSDEFDPREAVSLLYGATGDPRTREALWEFVQKSFDQVAARMPREFGSRIPMIGSGFCDEQHAQALLQFFRPKIKDNPGMDRSLAQSVEQVRQCAAFKARQGAAIAAYLRK